MAALYYTKLAENPKTISTGKGLNFLLCGKMEKVEKIDPDVTINVYFVDDVHEDKLETSRYF